MSFTFKVDYNNTYTETVYMGAGEHIAKVNKVYFREMDKEWNGQTVKLNNINLILVNSENETIFDTIWQNVVEDKDKKEAYLEYDMRKINTYSKLAQIPDGTVINSIDNWMEQIQGIKLKIEVEEYEGNDGKTRARIKNYELYESEGFDEKGLAF